jgi:hypothetical protein
VFKERIVVASFVAHGNRLYAASPPSIGGLTPNSGTGWSQIFTTTISEADGAATVAGVYFLVSNGWSAPYCEATYDSQNNLLYLNNSADNGTVGGFAPGSSGVVSNGICTLSGIGSSVFKVNNTLTLNVGLTFEPSTFAGAWAINIYAYNTALQSSGWQSMGPWTVPSTTAPISITSLWPTSGTGTSQTFTTTISEPNGATNVGGVYFDVGNGWSAPYCEPTYDSQNNLLYLNNSADNGTIGGFAPGSSGSVSNDICTLNGSGSSVSKVGNTLTLQLSLVFQPYSFAGDRSIKIYAYNTALQSSGWQNMGFWTVPGTLALPFSQFSDCIGPNNGGYGSDCILQSGTYMIGCVDLTDQRCSLSGPLFPHLSIQRSNITVQGVAWPYPILRRDASYTQSLMDVPVSTNPCPIASSIASPCFVTISDFEFDGNRVANYGGNGGSGGATGSTQELDLQGCVYCWVFPR